MHSVRQQRHFQYLSGYAENMLSVLLRPEQRRRDCNEDRTY